MVNITEKIKEYVFNLTIGVYVEEIGLIVIYLTGLRMRCAGRRVSLSFSIFLYQNPAANLTHREQEHRCAQLARIAIIIG